MIDREQTEQRVRTDDDQRQPSASASSDHADSMENAAGSFSNESRERTDGSPGANRGFAAMDPEKQKRIASEGGRAAHRQGVAHEWSKDEARVAGRKGGQIVSQNREHMSAIGRRGGQSSGQRRGQRDEREQPQ